MMASAAGALDWALLPEGCTVPEDAEVFACGALGTYVFGDPLAPLACPPTDGGVSTDDDAYPPPRIVGEWDGEAISTTDLSWHTPPGSGSGASGSGSTATGASGSAASSTAVSFAGLVAKSGGTPQAMPAALVIDWSDAHGAAVLSVVHQVAGDASRVGFLPLDSPALTRGLGESISDAHLLATLCSITDGITDGVAPPTVINLSFGRYAPMNILPDTCDQTLACHVSKVVEQLSDQSVVFTAAAGNHKTLLFPAKLDNVIAVGTLDLAHFAAHEEATPSWESPENVDVLLPGDGVCADGDLAAGASFASAAAAGYLAADYRNRTSLSSRGGVWMPMQGPECYVMGSSLSTAPSCVGGLDAFIRQTMSAAGCESADGGDGPDGGSPVGGSPPGDGGNHTTASTAPHVVKVRLSNQPAAMPDVPGYPEWQAGTHHPNPGGDPCVSCMDQNGGGGGGAALIAGVPLKASVMPLPGADIVLDLGGSAGLDDSYKILDVLLRVGNRFFRAMTNPTHAAELTSGEIDVLILEDALDLIHGDEQPSIVFVIGVDGDDNGNFTDAEMHWTSSPVYIP